MACIFFGNSDDCIIYFDFQLSEKFKLKIVISFYVSWLLVYFSQNVYHLYVARLLHGFVSGGVVIVTSLYLIEISNDR